MPRLRHFAVLYPCSRPKFRAVLLNSFSWLPASFNPRFLFQSNQVSHLFNWFVSLRFLATQLPSGRRHLRISGWSSGAPYSATRRLAFRRLLALFVTSTHPTNCGCRLNGRWPYGFLTLFDISLAFYSSIFSHLFIYFSFHFQFSFLPTFGPPQYFFFFFSFLYSGTIFLANKFCFVSDPNVVSVFSLVQVLSVVLII